MRRTSKVVFAVLLATAVAMAGAGSASAGGDTEPIVQVQPNPAMVGQQITISGTGFGGQRGPWFAPLNITAATTTTEMPTTTTIQALLPPTGGSTSTAFVALLTVLLGIGVVLAARSRTFSRG